MHGREVVERDEVVPLAVEGLGRGVLVLLVEPEGELWLHGSAAASRWERRFGHGPSVPCSVEGPQLVGQLDAGITIEDA